MAAPKKKAFVSKEELLREIAISKNTFCWFANPETPGYHQIVDSLDEVDTSIVAAGWVARVLTSAHIPTKTLVTVFDANGVNVEKTIDINFPPFEQYTWDGSQWTITARSHWEGSLHNGSFNMKHGKLTDRLAVMLFRMVDKFGNKSNWRNYSYLDEMKGYAVMELIRKALKYNEKSNSNPFSYYSSIMERDFKYILAREKRQNAIAQDLAFEAGVGVLTHNQQAKMDIDRYYGTHHVSHKTLEGEKAVPNETAKHIDHFSGLFRGI